jgi:hypothetical protein
MPEITRYLSSQLFLANNMAVKTKASFQTSSQAEQICPFEYNQSIFLSKKRLYYDFSNILSNFSQ